MTFDVPLGFDVHVGAGSYDRSGGQVRLDGIRSCLGARARREGLSPAAAGCPPSAELFRVLFVLGDETPEDELVARNADLGSCQAVSSWRRDVAPAEYAIYLRTGDENLSLEQHSARPLTRSVPRWSAG